MTMTSARRADLLRVVEKLNLPIIEDNVYGFLDNEPPLAALAPDSCIVIDSLSKKVAPGLALGFIVPPQRLRESVMASVRSGGWTASGFAFAAAQRMMGDGTVAELSRLKRLDARARQKLAVDRLSGFEIQTNEKCYHLWLTLPAHWRSQTFVAAAARRDIALTPSTTFAVTPRPCAERREAGVGGADHGSARYRPAHTGRNAERQGGGFRFDRIESIASSLALTPTGHSAIKPFALYGSILSHSLSMRRLNSGSVCQSDRGVSKLSTVISIFSTSGQCRCSVIG